METVLQVKGLSKQYKKGIYASHNVTFDVGKGEIFALIGPNGAGKTTTIRMISTLLQATEGDAIVAGHSILTEPDMVRKSITYLPDEAGAYKTMTGREYLEFMASIYADNGEQAYEFVKRGCEICELGDRLNDKISNYSRGMARKLLLARRPDDSRQRKIPGISMSIHPSTKRTFRQQARPFSRLARV